MNFSFLHEAMTLAVQARTSNLFLYYYDVYRLREMFHKENYLSLEKVTPMDKFANHYKMVF